MKYLQHPIKKFFVAVFVIMAAILLFGGMAQDVRAADPLYTITSPLSGDTWKVGQSVTVTWEPIDPMEPDHEVVIELKSGDGINTFTVGKATASDGSFTFTLSGLVGESWSPLEIKLLNGPAWDIQPCYVGQGYGVTCGRIEEASILGINLLPEWGAQIEVTSPVDGASYATMEPITISWIGAENASSIGLNLLQDGVVILGIGTVPNTGSYVFNAPYIPEPYIGSGYQIVATSMGNFENTDFSGTFAMGTGAPVAPDYDIVLDGPSSYNAYIRLMLAMNFVPSNAVSVRLYESTIPGALGNLKYEFSGPPFGGAYVGAFAMSYGVDRDTTYYYVLRSVNAQGVESANTDAQVIAWPTSKRKNIISPNGGETYSAGDTVTIQWDADVTGSVSLTLYQGSVCSREDNYMDVCGTPVALASVSANGIASDIPDTGSYQWTIPDGLLGNDFRIGLIGKDYGIGVPLFIDQSDNPFTIAPTSVAPSAPEYLITLQVPWPISAYAQMMLQINSSSVPGDAVNVRLYRSEVQGALGTAVYTFGSDTSGGALDVFWTGGELERGITYYYVLRSVNAQGVESANTDARVIAWPTSGMKSIISPNGGETYSAGDTVTIQWDGGGSRNVSLTLYQGSVCSRGDNYIDVCGTPVPLANGVSIGFASDIPDTGSYQWTIPEGFSGDDFWVGLSGIDYPLLLDQSDAPFSIGSVVNPAPSLTFRSPTSDTIIVKGYTQYSIIWDFKGMPTNWDKLVDVKYRATSGTDTITKTLATGYFSEGNGIDASSGYGAFYWNVPSTLADGTYEVVVSTTNVLDPITATSAEFSVVSSDVKPALKVITPNGGEAIKIGEPYTITWGTTGTVPIVALSLVGSGGGARFIATNVQNTGSYVWTPDAGRALGQYTISVGGSNYLGAIDGSDDVFALTDKDVTIASYYDIPAVRRFDMEKWGGNSVPIMGRDSETGERLVVKSYNPLGINLVGADGTVTDVSGGIPNGDILPYIISRGASSWLLVGQSTGKTPIKVSGLLFDGVSWTDASAKLEGGGCNRIYDVKWTGNKWLLLGVKDFSNSPSLCTVSFDGTTVKDMLPTIYGTDVVGRFFGSGESIKCSARYCFTRTPWFDVSVNIVGKVYGYDIKGKKGKSFTLPGASSQRVSAVGAPATGETKWLFITTGGDIYRYDEVSGLSEKLTAIQEKIKADDPNFMSLGSVGPSILRDPIRGAWILNGSSLQNFVVFTDSGDVKKYRTTFTVGEDLVVDEYRSVRMIGTDVLVVGFYAESKPAPDKSFLIRPRVYLVRIPGVEQPDVFANRKLFRVNNSQDVYVMKEGYLHRIPDAGTLAARRLDWDDVRVVPEEFLDGIPKGFEFMPEGAIMRASNGIDVYIIKYMGDKQFKRLILNPSVFNSYGHLRWEDIREVSSKTISVFPEVSLVRIAGENQIYRLIANGDVGTRQRINMAKLVVMGLDPESIYEINAVDWDSYTEGESLE